MLPKGPETQAEIVVHRFGGRRPMCRITGLAQTKIDNALRVGYFQHNDHKQILDAAIAARIPLSPMDFVAHLCGLVPAAAG